MQRLSFLIKHFSLSFYNIVLNQTNQYNENQHNFNTDIFNINDNTDLVGYFQTEKYFKDIANKPISLESIQDDATKCISIQPKILDKKKKELLAQGYKEEEVNEIIKGEIDKQKNLLKQVQEIKAKGFYNYVNEQVQKNTLPSANQVVVKVNEKMRVMVDSYFQLAINYKTDARNSIILQDKNLTNPILSSIPLDWMSLIKCSNPENSFISFWLIKFNDLNPTPKQSFNPLIYVELLCPEISISIS